MSSQLTAAEFVHLCTPCAVSCDDIGTKREMHPGMPSRSATETRILRPLRRYGPPYGTIRKGLPDPPHAGGGRSSQNTETAHSGTGASPRGSVGVTVREGHPHSPRKPRGPGAPPETPVPAIPEHGNPSRPIVRWRHRGPGTPVAAGSPAVSWRRARRSPTQGMDASPVRLGAPVRRTSRRRESRPLPTAPPCTHGTRPAPLPGRAFVMAEAPGRTTSGRATRRGGTTVCWVTPGGPRARRRARHP